MIADWSLHVWWISMITRKKYCFNHKIIYSFKLGDFELQYINKDDRILTTNRHTYIVLPVKQSAQINVSTITIS